VATNVSVIDSSGGGDHTTLASWEAATDNDLVTAGDIEVARIKDGDTITDASGFTMAGATVDISNYRQIDVAGANYDAAAATGSTWRVTTHGARMFISAENFTRVFGFRAFVDTTTPSTTNNRFILDTRGDTHILADVTAERTTASSANTSTTGAFKIRGVTSQTNNAIAYNLVVWGNGATTGFIRGTLHSTNIDIYNISAYNLSGDGIEWSSNGEEMKNCIAMDCGAEDIDKGSGTLDYCCSSDTTATGTNSISSQTSTDIWEDPANDDFNLKAGSNAIEEGEDKSGLFTTDILGATRPATWSMGAYEPVAGGVSVTPAAAVLTLNGVNPTVVKGSLSITPTAGVVTLLGVDPTVVNVVVFTPAAGVVTLLGVDPTVVLGSTSVTPAAGVVTLNGVDPTVVKGSLSITPAAGVVTLLGVDPTVVNATVVTPAAGVVTLNGVDPTVVKGSLSITPAAGVVTLNGVDPTVVLGSTSVTPAAGVVTLLGVNPVVTTGGVVVVPAPAVLTLNGVNPTVVKGSLSITPAAGVVTLLGVNPTVVKGSLSITPAAGVVTLLGVNPTVINLVALTPAAGVVTLLGVDPTVELGSISFTPTAGVVTLLGVNPTVLESGAAPPALLNSLIHTDSLANIYTLKHGAAFLAWDLIRDDYFQIAYAPLPFHGFAE